MTGLTNDVVSFLDELFPNPKCELKFSKDYELVIATMLSAQTTDKRVNMVTDVLFTKYPDLKSLSEASIYDVANIIKPIGTFKRKANYTIMIAKRLYKEYDGAVPNDRCYLESLPGVGRKTANVVLSNIFNIPCMAVDTHVKRVSIRLGLVYDSDSVNIIQEKLELIFKDNDIGRLHHQFVLFGRYFCMARKPMCNECKLRKYCKENKR